MGFFDKIKKMVGKTGVELDYPWIENPFPFGDPMIKATLRVKASGDAITIIGSSATFYAQRTNADGMKEEIVLGEESNNQENCASVERNGKWGKEFPDTIEAGGERSYGFFVGDMNVAKALSEWGVTNAESARINGVKFYFKGGVDVQETVGLFDPSLEQEITVK